jgi:chorismate mutase
MSDLDELRRRIDLIDSALLKLLNERTAIACEIGEIKLREGLPVFSPGRETLLIRGLVERSEGPLRPDAIRAIYREIMSAALSVEKDTVIASVGPAGSPSHRAALEKFGSSVRHEIFADAADVFSEVVALRADCGVVPLEDEQRTVRLPTLDALLATGLSVCAEIPGGAAPQAVGRQLVVGRHANPPSGCDRSMLAVRAAAGNESAVLGYLAGSGARRLASRPLDSNRVVVFIECNGHAGTLDADGTLARLESACGPVQILGSYPIWELGIGNWELGIGN